MDILPQLLVNALISGSIYALASAGLALTYGLLKILNFAHGHFLMLGVYFFYFLLVDSKLGFLPSALFTLLFCIALSAIALFVFIVPFIKYSSMLTLVSTLALSSIIEALVSMIFGVNVKSLSAGSMAESFEIGSVFITPLQILIILSAVILLSILSYVIHGTALGRKIRAMSENRFAANSLGINSLRLSLVVFSIATIITAFAGVLIGYETNMQPTMGTVYTIKAFAAMIIGGLGNIWGSVLGAYLLGLLENLGVGLDFWGYSIPAGYKDAFAFFVILLLLLVKPEGLFKKASRKT